MYLSRGGLILKNTNNYTGDAGSLLAYHPLRDTFQYKNNEKMFKNSCCASGHCYIYYNKRPHGPGDYSPPAGGKIKAQILHNFI